MQHQRLKLTEFGGYMNIFKKFNHLRVLGLLLVGLLIPSLGFAGIRDDRSSEIQVFYTLILGPGVALAYNLGDHLAVGGAFYAATLEGEGETEENDETYKAEFSTSELFVRIYPFEGAGFYVSAASVFRNWEITLEGTETDIGGSGQPGDYTVTAEWPDTGVAYGLGYNWIADFGLSWGLYLGALSGGDPELKGETDVAGVTQDDIDRQVKEVEEEENFGERFNTVAVVRLSIGFNF